MIYKGRKKTSQNYLGGGEYKNIIPVLRHSHWSSNSRHPCLATTTQCSDWTRREHSPRTLPQTSPREWPPRRAYSHTIGRAVEALWRSILRCQQAWRRSVCDLSSLEDIFRTGGNLDMCCICTMVPRLTSVHIRHIWMVGGNRFFMLIKTRTFESLFSTKLHPSHLNREVY